MDQAAFLSRLAQQQAYVGLTAVHKPAVRPGDIASHFTLASGTIEILC